MWFCWARNVLVLTAIGTVPIGTTEKLGFHVQKRPVSISRVVATAARAIRAQS